MINVLVVDDSLVARMTLKEILEEDPKIRVAAMLENGRQALSYVEKIRPDVITMDVIMPEMDGFEATRRIMETNPVPIVIITSSFAADEVEKTFKAMEAGAVTILPKPGYVRESAFENAARHIREQVRLMAGVKVVRRWRKERGKKNAPLFPASFPSFRGSGNVRLAAIGASTGGPVAVQSILSSLPASFPIPILIVQHIGAEFIDGMVHWLSQTCSMPIHIAKQHEIVAPGHVYFAPDDWHMTISSTGAIRLDRETPEENVRPSASRLFHSIALNFGADAVGVLLTGMGRDGASGLKAMRDANAITIVQDEASSVVWGMPGEAVRLNAVNYILDIKDIPARLLNLAGANWPT